MSYDRTDTAVTANDFGKTPPPETRKLGRHSNQRQVPGAFGRQRHAEQRRRAFVNKAALAECLRRYNLARAGFGAPPMSEAEYLTFKQGDRP
jgi:hypothetical protein